MANKFKLSTKEAAAYLGVKRNTLEVWRCQSRGPKYAKIGSRVLYDQDDLEAFFVSRIRNTRDSELERFGVGQ
jgi:excisionase family DNA binding protein